MIQANSSKTQQFILPSTNKALAQVLRELPPEKFAQLSQAKDLSSILNTIFDKSSINDLQNQKLLELLKNNPTLKELGSIKTTFKELLSNLENQKQNLPIQKHLQTMLEHIKNIDDKTLRSKVELQTEFKTELLKTKAEIENSSLANKTQLLQTIDKLTLQLDYYQLASHLTNGTALYIPYDFDALEDGNFSIKKDKNDAYFCDIDLKLKEYGDLNLRLGLFEKKYLNINISTENTELKKRLQSDLEELKMQIKNTGLHLKEIRFLEPVQNQYSPQHQEINLGFEVKI